MKKNTMTKQQLLLEIEELRTRLDTMERSLKEAKELLQVKITEHKRTEEALKKTQQYAQSIMETIHYSLVVLTADLKVISANHSFYQTFKVTPKETEGRFIYSIGKKQWDIPLLRKLLEEIIPKNTHFNNFKVDHEFPAIGRRTMLLNARRIYREGKGTEMILLAIEDISERTQWEEVLKISETRYRRLFEAAQDGILILDADTGQISDVNPFLIKMLGYSHGDFLGKKLWEIGVFKDIEASKAVFSELQNKGYVRYEDLPLETRDGRHIDVEFVSNVYLVDHKKVIQCNIRDITKRHRAEESVRRANQQINTILNNISDGFLNLDNEFVVNYINQAAERMLGRRSEDVLARKLFDAFPEARGSIFEDILTRTMKEKQFTSFETYFETKPYQNWYDLRVYPHENGISVYFQVITERKKMDEELHKSQQELEIKVQERTVELAKSNQALQFEIEEHKRTEEALRQSEMKYRIVADNTYDWEWWRDPKGNFTYISPSCKRITYYKEEEFIKDPNLLFKIIHPNDKSSFISHQNEIEEKHVSGEIEFRIIRHDGSVRWVAHACQPVFDEQGYFLGRRGSNRDITERKIAEEALRESEKRLRLLSSQLLSVQEKERKRIALELHDGIGQILATIKFDLDRKLSQMGKATPPPGISLENIIPLVQNSIDEVRRIQMDLRPSVLDDLGIIATIKWFTREFQKVYSHISVEKQISVEENEIPDSLKTILFRIMQEAMNNVTKHSKADLVRLILRKKGKGIELIIEDNGAGFDPENINQGLGLTSMRERMELSNGTFSIESIPGKGTTVKASWTI